MVLRIELPPEIEAQYAAEADAKGLPLEMYVRNRLVAQAVPGAASTRAKRLSAFREWVTSHAPGAPLSEEAISRESMYGKRG